MKAGNNLTGRDIEPGELILGITADMAIGDEPYYIIEDDGELRAVPTKMPGWMPDWKERVVEEKHELDQKIAKLRVFIEGKSLEDLSAEEQRRLGNQLFFMQRYSSILAERIMYFS